MGELPKGWEISKIDAVSDSVQYGYTAKSDPNHSSGVKYLRITDIQEEKVDWDQVPFCSIDQETKEKFLLVENDIVFARTGATVGKSFLINEIPVESVFASYLIRLRPSKSIEAKYIRYFFGSLSYWNQISENATGIGQPNVNASKLKEIHFPLPPLPEQKRIVAKLDALFGELEGLKGRMARIPALLKAFRQAVLTQAVTGKLTAEWREGKIKAGEELGEWEELTFGETIMGSPKNGAYYPRSLYGKGTLIIRIDCFYDGKLDDWGKVQRVEIPKSDLDTYGVNQNEILINRVNSIEYLGKCVLLEEIPEPCIYESNMMRVKPDFSKLDPFYARVFLTSPKGLMELRKTAKHAVNQASINQQDVKSVIINLPPIEEQQEIVRRVDGLFAQAEAIEQRYERLQAHITQLPQAILAKAFRGELVEQLESDGSAEELLGEIKRLKEGVKGKSK